MSADTAQLHRDLIEHSILPAAEADALLSPLIALKPAHSLFFDALSERTLGGTATEVPVADLLISLVHTPLPRFCRRRTDGKTAAT